MDRWARWIVSHSWWWVILWPAAGLLAWHGAPRLSTLLADDTHDFLPNDMPSRRAHALMREEFPDTSPASRAVVIAVRGGGLLSQDQQYLVHLAEALQAQHHEWEWNVRAVGLYPFLSGLLESTDGQAAIIVVDLPADMLTHSSVNRVRAIQRLKENAGPPPSGLTVEITGSAALGELLDANAKRDVDRTTLWTFLGVVVVLLAVYRSPLAMLLPVVTIGLSLVVALGLVGRAAAAWLPVNGLVEMFIIVILAGAGVDYCLFLFARYAEERQGIAPALGLASDESHRASTQRHAVFVERAVALTGAGVLGSAVTNVAGLVTLAFARNRDLYSSGPTIAFCLLVATLAVLTLAPALMRITGHALFWPASLQPRPNREGPWWPRVARAVTSHPGKLIGLCLVGLTPFALGGMLVVPTYDSLLELPAESSFVRGARLYQKHFQGGRSASELTILLSAERSVTDSATLPLLAASLDEYARVARESTPGTRIRDYFHPLGREEFDDAWKSGLGGRVADEAARRLASPYYISGSGQTARIEVSVPVDPRTIEGASTVFAHRSMVQAAVQKSGLVQAGGSVQVHIAGDAARYRDIRALRSSDFLRVAIAATTAIFMILLVLTRSPLESLILIGASLLVYLATYGLTFLVVRLGLGLQSVSYQIDFLLFVILMSLGQDYNIYVVTRIREELRKRPPDSAIEFAIRRTGKVVSGCGLIMALAFASMYSGSLMLMKQFAIALSLGILIDTFLIRPLFVPAVLLLIHRHAGGAGLRVGAPAAPMDSRATTAINGPVS